jgi:hypothetical protein
MEGTCKCGGRIKQSRHNVETDKGASAWLEPLKSYTLPLTVTVSQCSACGRRRTEVDDADGTRIMVKG